MTENGYTKEDYIFKGWATSSDGEVILLVPHIILLDICGLNNMNIEDARTS